MDVSVIKDDSLWKSLKKQGLQINRSDALEVGFFPEDRYGSENENLPVAQIAQWNNEGKVDVPPRPFFTATIVAPLEAGKMRMMFLKSIDRIHEGKSTFLQEYKLTGADFVLKLKTAIEDWDTPPNAPSTIAEKGFNDPLIKTGKMKDSVKYKIGGD